MINKERMPHLLMSKEQVKKAPFAPREPIGEALLRFPILNYAYDYVCIGSNGEYPKILLMVYWTCEDDVYDLFKRECPEWLVPDYTDRTQEGAECYIVKSTYWCVGCNQITALECFEGRCPGCDNKTYENELLEDHFWQWHCFTRSGRQCPQISQME